MKRRRLHSCEATITAARPWTLHPCCEAHVLGVVRTTVQRLVEEEALPSTILHIGEGGRRIVRFDLVATERWRAERRERQVEAVLDGRRYIHRQTPRATEVRR